MQKIKQNTFLRKKRKIHYVLNEKKQIMRYKPWLGDMFAFLYDRIMQKSIFPKKFAADPFKHIQILRNEYKELKNKQILEFATGTGNIANFLDQQNSYTGSDISPGLLRRAVRNFSHNGFQNADFFVCQAEQTPFSDNFFDTAISNLALNFFPDIEKFLAELQRVLKPEACFFCSVPLPEKKTPQAKIRGTLFSENQLKKYFENYNFRFEAQSYENGALLYFRAFLK